MISRDLAAATRQEFDVVVVGGGIYGVSLLQEAVRRGLTACLCEADDFGGGTSWNSLRIVHGGLRYLQTLDLRRFLQSVSARRRLALQFPALLRPLECLMPLYAEGMKRRSVMRVALVLNDLLSGHRNRGVVASVHLPGGRVLGAQETLDRFPQVRDGGLEGSAMWTDYFMLSSERILMELLRDACRRGATALNYAPVQELLVDGDVARGVRVRDRIDGGDFEIVGRAVVNCAGPRVRALAAGRGGDSDELFRPSLAFNILLDRTLPTRSALAVAAPEAGAPVLFVVPQEHGLLAGTLHVPRPPETLEARVSEAEVARYLDLLNQSIPGLDAGLRHVQRVFAGLLPASTPHGSDLVKREVLRDHGKTAGLRRLYSVCGVKFTTANDVACQVLAMIGIAAQPRSDPDPLPLSGVTDWLIDADRIHRATADEVAATMRRVVAEESVHCLDDLVLRRTNWAVTGAPLDTLRSKVAGTFELPETIAGYRACV
jgi:glycerol-3-phosphate dehydrogenase